jgi:putative tryptophan/tyrosine transport system substrate-binding protein
MRRREFITLVGGAAATLGPGIARAQQPAMPVIGYLAPQLSLEPGPRLNDIRGGLSETGYVEGRNLAIEYRWAEYRLERLPALAADLVRRRVALIIAPSTPSALAAKAETDSIPIVFQIAGDPVRTGLVASLNRPGGNLTGISNLFTEAAGKRLELLKEVVPAVLRWHCSPI